MRALVAGAIAALFATTVMPASAQLSVIAADNEANPLVSRLTNVDTPTIGDDGSVVFTLKNAMDCVIVTWRAGTYRCVATNGMALPSGGKLTSVWGVEDHGPISTTGPWLAFTATVDGSRTSLFGWQDGTLKRLAGAAGDPPLKKLAVTNKNGESLAFQEDGKLWLVSNVPAMSTLFTPGMPVPGLTGYTGVIQSEFPQLDDKGQATFVVNATSTVTSDARAVVMQGVPEKLVMDQPLGAPTDPWNANNVYANGDGFIVYNINVEPKDSTVKPWSGLWAGLVGATERAVRFPVTVGSSTVITNYAEYSPIVIARGGRFVFKGAFEDPKFPSSSKYALVFVDRGVPSLVAAEESPVPAMPEAKVHKINNYAIADNGDVYAAVEWTNLTDSSKFGQAIIMHGAGPTDRVIVKTGDMIDIGPVNKTQRVEYVGLAQNYGAGYPRGLNAKGQLAALIAFDGATLKKAVLVTTLTDPNAKLPDLRVDVSATEWPAGKGSLFISISNDGDADATGVVVDVTSPYPGTMRLESTDPNITEKPLSNAPAAKESRVRLARIPAGGSATLIPEWTLTGIFPNGPVPITVRAMPSEIDKNPANNSATANPLIYTPPEEDKGFCICGSAVGRGGEHTPWVGLILVALLARRRRD
jgi:hypothetical protein